MRLSGALPPSGRYDGGTFLHGAGAQVSMAGVTEPATGPEPEGPVTGAELAGGDTAVLGTALDTWWGKRG